MPHAEDRARIRWYLNLSMAFSRIVSFGYQSMESRFIVGRMQGSGEGLILYVIYDNPD